MKTLLFYRQWILAGSFSVGMSFVFAPYSGFDLPDLNRYHTEKISAYLSDLNVDEIHALLRYRMKEQPESAILATANGISRLSLKFGFRPSFILSVIQAESGFHSDVVSKTGAIGLMQLMPSTAQFVATKLGLTQYHGRADLYRPEINVAIGIYYLNYLRARLPQFARFLRAYNMGPSKFNRISPAEAEKLPGVGRYVDHILTGVRKIVSEARAQNLFGKRIRTEACAPGDLTERWIGTSVCSNAF